MWMCVKTWAQHWGVPPFFFFPDRVFQWTWGSLIWLKCIPARSGESSCLHNYKCCWDWLCPAFMWMEVLILMKPHFPKPSPQDPLIPDRSSVLPFTKPYQPRVSEILSQGRWITHQVVHHLGRANPRKYWEETSCRDSHVYFKREWIWEYSSLLIKRVHFCFAFLCFVLLQNQWHGKRKEREMLRFGKHFDLRSLHWVCVSLLDH